VSNSIASYTSWSQPELEASILEQINTDVAWPVVEQFSKIVRLSGSDEERKALKILTDHLASWGVDFTVHEPECFISWPLGATLRTTGENGKSFHAKTTAMSKNTDGVEFEAELVYVPPRIPENTTDDWSFGLDFTGLDVAGKIVVADGMSAPGRVIDVMKAGAIAGIFVNPGEAIHESIVTTIWGAPDVDSVDRQPDLPVLGVNRRDGNELIALGKAGGTKVAFSTKVETKWRTIPVLEAVIPGATVPDEFILLHGHLDSWHEGVGDNATGDATMLELARVFQANKDKLARTIKIAWWSGHSHGRYAGSTWYADAFGIDMAKGCVAQVNCDSPGCRWATTYNELTAMTETWPFINAAIGDTTGITPQPERPVRAGDYSFNQIGISSFYMLSSTMPQALRDEKGYYGVGGCGANIEWHTEDDLMHVADRDILLRDIKMYATSLLRVANAGALPFDFLQTTAEFKGTLNKYQQAAGNQFDFSPSFAAIDALDLALNSFYANAPVNDDLASAEARAFNKAQRTLARQLVQVNYSRELPFHHDPAMDIPALPDLAPAMSLPKVKEDPHGRGVAKASLMRGQNRLIWALELSREAVENAQA
jgi:hypothetical protein